MWKRIVVVAILASIAVTFLSFVQCNADQTTNYIVGSTGKTGIIGSSQNIFQSSLYSESAQEILDQTNSSKFVYSASGKNIGVVFNSNNTPIIGVENQISGQITESNINVANSQYTVADSSSSDVLSSSSGTVDSQGNFSFSVKPENIGNQTTITITDIPSQGPPLVGTYTFIPSNGITISSPQYYLTNANDIMYGTDYFDFAAPIQKPIDINSISSISVSIYYDGTWGNTCFWISDSIGHSYSETINGSTLTGKEDSTSWTTVTVPVSTLKQCGLINVYGIQYGGNCSMDYAFNVGMNDVVINPV